VMDHRAASADRASNALLVHSRFATRSHGSPIRVVQARAQWSRPHLALRGVRGTAFQRLTAEAHAFARVMVSVVCYADLEQWFPEDRAWSHEPLRKLRHIVV
jgi:hypothetical protein